MYSDGKLADKVADITSLWQEDFVTFILDCSFSFEQALEGRRIAVSTH